MNSQRSTPFFNALLKADSNKRISILQAFPSYVIDDLVEILYNVVLGNVPIGNRKQKLRKYKKILLDIVNTNNKISRRRKILRQRGGFLGTLLPVILSIIGNRIFRK